jgi:VWFA-related protein
MPSLPPRSRLRRAPTRFAVAATLCLLAAALGALPPAIAAASAKTRAVARGQTSAPPQYTIQARVPLTIVDVTVTDAKGQPVHGLKQSDFTILEDKQEMKPNSFEEHRSDEAPPAAALVKQNLPPNTFTNSTPTPPSPTPPNILLLDELNTPAHMQQQVTQRMLDFVNKMKPGTQVAVFRLTTHLSILQGFTSDRDLLRAALNSKSNFAWESPIGDDSGGDIEIQGAHSASQAEYTFSAMREIARYVSGMKGRKNLMWVSGSFPVQYPPVTDPNSGLMQGKIYDLSGEMQASTDAMVRAHVAIYPIDWRGPMVAKPWDIFGERGTMQDMADQTGGKFFYNTNGYAEAVQQSIDLGSNFYTLTYTPTNQTLDTRFRTITVKVDQPGLHLDYRNGYYAVDATVDASGKKIETLSPMQSAMMRGALDATQILFKVKATEAPVTETTLAAGNIPDPKQMHAPYRRISIAYSIDVHGIDFSTSPDGNYRGGFEYGVRVYNADGDEIVNSAVKTVDPILLPSVYRSMLANGANAHQEIDVPATGDYFLRIAVHDLNSNHVGALEIPTASVTPEKP